MFALSGKVRRLVSPDAQQRAFNEAQRNEATKRLERAVADVMGGDVALYAAARNRGVSDDALREALRAKGWTPPHLDGRKRRTFGSGKRHGT